VFDALAVVFSSALRGAGDTVYPMLITLLSSWLVMVLPASLIIRSDNPTIFAIWMTCTIHISLTGFCMWMRYLTGRWQRLRLASDAVEEVAV
jgi:MATE family multidrug resistance protein